ncbi:glycosyltransferase [Williamsia herbipolensis]|uniref:Glycosyltransferase n=1 Tax=Williamsia herbipolensis TaxID=1603258 RepID=A0AAU4K6V6_9NOCA|nr:glycosyltransferase [Williamsia herbipolensis]
MPDRLSSARITVVTIVRDDPEGLAKTIASVRGQTTVDVIDHVVIDGASGPGTTELLEHAQHIEHLGGFRWVSEADGGRYDAMNKGIAMAETDLLWLLHAGDTFGSPRAVEWVLAATGDGFDGWGYGFARKVDGAGDVVGLFGYAPFSLRRFALGGKSLPHQACFFSTDLQRRVGAYDVDFGLAADQLHLLRCAVVTPPLLVPELICDFDTTGAGTSMSIRDHYLAMRAARVSTDLVEGSLLRDRAITEVLIAISVAANRMSRLVSRSGAP